ncbi:MAG TPA: hypothetical protein VNZ02_03960 [Steroidobacteraceae bacterium]|jgi:hypothetical protein|nr:hypothetical protein [Steroidobacteraceae bacterium]
MGYVKRMTMTLVVMFIAGCSSSQPPAPPVKTVYEPRPQQLDRAREVQKTIDENAEQMRKALENQERGDKP